jgi:hypothetical protein
MVIPSVVNQHSMTTGAKRDIHLPAIYHVAPLSLIPKTYRTALADPNWRAAMLRSMLPFSRRALGIWLHGPWRKCGDKEMDLQTQVQRLMVRWRAIKLAGFSVASHNAPSLDFA